MFVWVKGVGGRGGEGYNAVSSAKPLGLLREVYPRFKVYDSSEWLI